VARRITQPPLITRPETGTLLSVEEVARAIQRHPEVVRRHARDGRLPADKIGRGWFFYPERLVAAGYTQFGAAVSAAATSAAEAERSQLFLRALSEAGHEAVQLLDEDAIFSAVGRRLAEAGLASFFFLLTDGGEGLRIVHRDRPAGTASSEPQPEIGRVLPLSKMPTLKLVCETRQPQYIGDPETLIRRTADHLGPAGMARARRLSRDLGMRTAISAPLLAGDRLLGAVTVVAGGLREADMPAMAAFANQTAALVAAARLLRQSRESEEAMVRMLAMAIDMRVTSNHRPADYVDFAADLAQHLNLDPETVRRIRYAVLLQDLGKLGIPDLILHKQGQLDSEERAVLMTHPVVGEQFLGRFKPLRDVGPIIRAHHEWYNGEGYPDGLKGDAIPLETRLLSVINAFATRIDDATSRPPTLIADALRDLQPLRGVSLDPDLVDAFTSMCEQPRVDKEAWLTTLRPGGQRPFEPGIDSGLRDVLTVADSRELRIIYRIAHETGAVLDLDVMLRRIVAIIREVMGYYLVSLLLPSGTRTGELRMGAYSGYVTDLASTTIAGGEGITGWVFEHGEPLIVADVREDPRYIALDPNVRSELAFPLISGGRVVGVLNAESAQPNAFTDADLSLMLAVGTQLAATLEVAQMHDHLKQEAMRDPLTRVYNRRLLVERLQQAIAHADRHREGLSIVFIDVNQLKRVNDTYGHLAGDALLREVAHALTDAVRSEDLVARYGGDEFVVILSSTSGSSATVVAQRIRDGIARHRFMASGQLITVPGVSLGIASFPEHGRTPEELLASADASLYQQKRGLTA
jgi:diguanylate cyclase (GGDEF)-like protein